jgi:hypothetical protein
LLGLAQAGTRVGVRSQARRRHGRHCQKAKESDN